MKIFASNGISELMKLATIGGIESGSFIFNLLFSTNLLISTVSNPMIIATNKPFVPKLLISILLFLSTVVATIKKVTNEIIPSVAG